MSIYMQADNIKGDVTTKNYSGQIQVTSVAFDAHRHIANKVGHEDAISAGYPEYHLLRLNKPFCSAMAELLNHFNKGTVLNQVILTLCNSSSDAPEPYLIYRLDQVEIATMHFSSADSLATTLVSLELSYNTIEWRFTRKNAKNQPMTPVSMGYDLANATVI